jgi:hypothetical protein
MTRTLRASLEAAVLIACGYLALTLFALWSV